MVLYQQIVRIALFCKLLMVVLQALHSSVSVSLVGFSNGTLTSSGSQLLLQSIALPVVRTDYVLGYHSMPNPDSLG